MEHHEWDVGASFPALGWLLTNNRPPAVTRRWIWGLRLSFRPKVCRVAIMMGKIFLS